MKKKLLKQIRQVANELPEMTYASRIKEYVYRQDKNGKEMYDDPKVLLSKRVQFKVNHTRRLKRLVEKIGFDEGVNRYLKSINNQR